MKKIRICALFLLSIFMLIGAAACRAETRQPDEQEQTAVEETPSPHKPKPHRARHKRPEALPPKGKEPPAKGHELPSNDEQEPATDEKAPAVEPSRLPAARPPRSRLPIRPVPLPGPTPKPHL